MITRAWPPTRDLILPMALMLLCVVAVLGPQLAPYEATAPDFRARLQGVSPAHLLGTDQLGRDTASRLLVGARSSIGLSLAVSTLAALLGCVVGLAGAAAGPRTDAALTRITEVFQSFPGFIVAVAIAGAFGPSVPGIVLTLVLTGWMAQARLVRGLTRSLMTQDYVVAARLYGVGALALAWRHLLPRLLPPVIVVWSEGWSRAILAVSGLGFLGMGTQPPHPEWGAMLADGRSYMAAAPLLMLAPGLAILLSVLTINLTGDWLRDRFAIDETKAA
jgi:ABC-type dipeptide/oligopeptide/nickel transport system permease subunit